MTEVLFESPAARQSLLRQEILDATAQKDEKILDHLHFQWVHRYGLESLPFSTQVDSSNSDLFEYDQQMTPVEKDEVDEITFRHGEPMELTSSLENIEHSEVVEEETVEAITSLEDIEHSEVVEEETVEAITSLEDIEHSEVVEEETVEAITSFNDVRSMLNGYVDEVKNILNEKKKSKIDDLQSQSFTDSQPSNLMPPPRRISHLSRWLPGVDDEDLPKAS